MPRKNLYPISPEKLKHLLIDFYINGNKPNGSKGFPARKFPIEHYNYIGIKGHEGNPNTVIESNSVTLMFHCNKHDEDLKLIQESYSIAL